ISWTTSGESVRISDGERLCWLFALIPVTGYIGARFVTHAFFNRYFMGMLPGLAVAIACTSFRMSYRWHLTSWGLLVLLAGFGGSRQLRATLHPENVTVSGRPYQQQIKEMLALEPVLVSEGKQYIAFYKNLF